MQFISYDQLYKDCLRLAARLPRVRPNFDMVAGIARSGIFPATILAQILNCRLGIVDMKLGLQFIRGGARDTGSSETYSILVIDDSVASGTSMIKVKELLEPLKFNYLYACIYCEPGSEGFVNMYARILPQPRVFAWNIMNHGILENSCVDMDGILCVEPTPSEAEAEKTSGVKYKYFVEHTPPLHLPRQTIHSIVTGRYAEHEEETRTWLEKHGIKFKNLIMRTSEIPCEIHKAEYYEKSGTELFIESTEFQAKEIQRMTRKPVISMDTLMLV